LIQANSTHEPSFSHIVGFTQAGNGTHWLKAFERSFADFLPLLCLGSDIKVGITDLHYQNSWWDPNVWSSCHSTEKEI
jgi:hypothetical protein